MSNNWPSGPGTFGLKEPYFSQYYDHTLYPTGAGGYYGAVDPIGEGNPYACQKVYDFGIRHLRETPLIAKEIINHYYGSYPEFSYFSGGSNGGKEGMISSQKLYDIYDGFYIGCPLGGHVAVTFRGTWDTLKGAGLSEQADPSCTPTPPFGGCPTVYSEYKAELHYQAVYDKCDGVDGLLDGLIDDPRKCNFDALTDLPACSPEEEADDSGRTSTECFTLAQRQALKDIYDGPYNSKGKAWYVGTPLGAEYVTARGSGFGAALNDGFAPGMFANIALDPPDGPYFDITTFDWDEDPKAVMKTTCEQCYNDDTCETFNVHDVLDAITLSPKPAPNMGGLEPLYEQGGKIIQHHGWSDALVSALGGSSQFYEEVMKIMGAERTKSFYKLYLVPGAGHCGGGIGCYPTSGFQALVDWVEDNIEPGALIGTRASNTDLNWPEARTRPICPYPEVARWNGTGSIEAADSFICVPPIKVRIKPEALNLKRKGVFTAFITMPHEYRMKDWNLQDLTCEGAPAKFGFAFKNVYVAKFATQDLQDVTTGKSVTLTVKGEFQVDGAKAHVQASDAIKVIKKHKKPPRWGKKRHWK